MSKYYILEGKKPKVVSLMEWATQHARQRADRSFILEHTNIQDTLISTVFLGIDHYYGDDPDHAPVLFETMICTKDKWWDYQCRYCTWDEAMEGHKKAIDFVLEA